MNLCLDFLKSLNILRGRVKVAFLLKQMWSEKTFPFLTLYGSFARIAEGKCKRKIIGLGGMNGPFGLVFETVTSEKSLLV